VSGESNQHEKCIECGTRRPLRALQCPVCLRTEFATGIVRPRNPRLPEGLLGEHPWVQPPLIPGTIGAIAGPKGSGKSTLLTILLDDPLRDVWMTGEEATGLVYARAARFGRDYDVVEVDGVKPLEREIARLSFLPTRRVVVDSITVLGGHKEQLAGIYMLRKAARDFGWIVVVVLQFTQDGSVRGLAEIGHAVDWLALAMYIHGRRALGFDKNRLGKLVTIPWRFAEDGTVESVVDTEGIYSVEGDEGQYVLQRFPIGSPKWAAPWSLAANSTRGLRAMRELRGVATAAVYAPFDEDLFIGPNDLTERREHAQNSGLRFIDPWDLKDLLRLDDPLDRDDRVPDEPPPLPG
jgi:hypothetical protein